MTSQRVERTWIRTGGYGRFRGEWVKFYFPLCLGIVMYDNEVTTKGNKVKPRMKLNHNSYLGEHNNLDPPPIPLSKVSVWVVFCYWLEKRHLIA